MVQTRSQSSKYISRVTQVKDFPETIETTIRISRSTKSKLTGKVKQIDVDEVHSILTNMQNSLGPNSKIMVRAMNAQRLFTFKGFKQDELQMMDFEKYYEDKVAETEKFEKFKYLEFTALITKPPNTKAKPKPKIKKVKKNLKI
jgi:hypothetical protein